MKKKIIIISLAVVLVISAIVGISLYIKSRKTMISVVGMDYEKAYDKITSTKDIKVIKMEEENDQAYSYKEGYVYIQNVKPGDTTDKVKLYVGRGIAYKMPDLFNKKYKSLDVKTKSVLAKIDEVNVLYKYDNFGVGRIIETSNDGMERVFKEEPLDIMVCQGKLPYPEDNLNGKNWNKIKKYFKGATINVTKKLSKKKAGTILSFNQKPAKIAKNIWIDVEVSNGKGINAPDVTGLSEKKARKKLNKAGINYKIKYVYKDMYSNAVYQKKKVVSQSDDGLVNKNETIVVKVKKPAIKVNQIDHEVNSAGGVDTDIKFTNTSHKKINYVVFTCRYYNSVGDPIDDEIDGGYEARLKYTGPLSGGSSDESHWNAAIYDYSTACIAPYSAEVTFSDGSEQTITFMKKYKSYRYWYSRENFKEDDIHDPDMED